tara:strand:+ start:113 stop:511 length:399 start_codon:yes stop_codon:yes gene_type:complete
MKQITLAIFIIFISNCSSNKKENYEKGIIRYNKILYNFKNPNIDNGEKIFKKSCITCHLYGSGGATILNDKISWKSKLETKSLQDIYINVLYGYAGSKGAMPIKGACLDCTDSDLVDVISYIYNYNNLLIHH